MIFFPPVHISFPNAPGTTTDRRQSVFLSRVILKTYYNSISHVLKRVALPPLSFLRHVKHQQSPPRPLPVLCLSLTTSSRHWSPAFFSKARTASTVGTILFFAALFPYFAVDQDGVSSNQRRAACLLPPTCLALGTVPLREFEDSGVVSMFLYCRVHFSAPFCYGHRSPLFVCILTLPMQRLLFYVLGRVHALS